MALRLINYLVLFVIATIILYGALKHDFYSYSPLYQTKTRAEIIPRLTHVVVPFHAKQIDRIQAFFDLWIKHKPCIDSNELSNQYNVKTHYNPPLGTNIELVFFIGSMNDTEIVERQVMRMYNDLPASVKKCFSHVHTEHYRFNQTDNSYLLGAKAMFEKFLNADLNVKMKPYYAFYMEPDVRPIRSGWLSYTDAQCRWPLPMFWIKGSQFRGTPLPRHCKNIVTKMHVNGNALYNLHDPAFKKHYYDMVLPFLKQKGHKPWLLAYDLFFMTNVLENEDQYPEYQKDLHKFVLSDFIQNRWHVNYTVNEVLEESESTFLVHGGTQIQ